MRRSSHHDPLDRRFAFSAWQLGTVIDGMQFLKSTRVAVGVEVIAQRAAAVVQGFAKRGFD